MGVLRRSILLLTLTFTTVSIIASASPQDTYHYVRTIESSATPLVHLASYSIGPGGFFKIAVDVALRLDTSGADHGRTMLHLIVCDTDAVARFTHLPLRGNGSRVSDRVPSYCAMANQTLGNLCRSYPLLDQSTEDNRYRSQKTVEVVWTLDDSESTIPTTATTSSKDDQLHFYIDACETVGGVEGVLRSCLGQEDSLSPGASDCFSCPKNSNAPSSPASSCEVTPAIKPTMLIHASMNLCTKDGACLSQDTFFLATTYLVLTIAWGFTWVVWATHIRTSRDAVVSLQTKMQLVPAVLCVYAGLMCAALSTDQLLYGTARQVLVNSAILSQVFALAVPAEVVILLAKGWQITRAELEPREHPHIRVVTLVWAIACTILQRSVVKHLMVFLVWGVAWSSIVFMIWYNSAFNLNMLRYQITMVRHLQVDPTRTPVFTKYQLFRRFRALLGLYMFCSCLLALSELARDGTHDPWRWTATAAEEALNFGLYVAIGYAFRCRRFSNLLQAPASPYSDGNAVAPINASASIAPTGLAPPPLHAAMARAKSSVVVVMNPDPCEQSLGTSYVPVKPPKPTTHVMMTTEATRDGGNSATKKDSVSP